jgi:hypothetical protein
MSKKNRPPRVPAVPGAAVDAPDPGLDIDVDDELLEDEDPPVVEMLLAISIRKDQLFRVLVVEREGESEAQQHTLGYVDKRRALQEVLRVTPRLQRFIATGKLAARRPPL